MRLFFDNPTKLKNYRVFLHVRSFRENTKSEIQKKVSHLCDEMQFFLPVDFLMALDGQTFKKTRDFLTIRPACQKKCAHLCDEMLEKMEIRF